MVKCDDCENTYNGTEEFCPPCGSKLQHVEPKEKKPEAAPVDIYITNATINTGADAERPKTSAPYTSGTNQRNSIVYTVAIIFLSFLHLQWEVEAEPPQVYLSRPRRAQNRR